MLSISVMAAKAATHDRLQRNDFRKHSRTFRSNIILASTPSLERLAVGGRLRGHDERGGNVGIKR
jgi:hypothetical protein